jgi:hypothetical protein
MSGSKIKLRGFIEVGNVIREIRGGKLYQGEYETFEEYCRKL